MRRKWRTFGILGLLAACVCACGAPLAWEGGDGAANRETIRLADKTITVIDAPPLETGGVSVAGIARIPGMALDFVSDDAVLLARGGDAQQQKRLLLSMPMSVSDGAADGTGTRLYRRDLRTGAEELLTPSEAVRSDGKLSPDRKHLFYLESRGEDMFGVILDVETGEEVRFSSFLAGYQEAAWLDDRRVAVGTIENHVLVADVDGDVGLVHKGGFDRPLFSLGTTGDGLYFVAGTQLLFLPAESLAPGAPFRPPEVLADLAVSVAPSPDGKQLALVRRESSAVRTLVITDAKANELVRLSSATQVYGVAWSPDAALVAYHLMSEDLSRGASGLFVADTLTGETTPLTVDVQYAARPLRWSPSGDKVMTTTWSADEGFVTYVVTLEKGRETAVSGG